MGPQRKGGQPRSLTLTALTATTEGIAFKAGFR